MNKTFVFLLFVLCVSACHSASPAANNQINANLVAHAETPLNISQVNIRQFPTKGVLSGEVVSCSPEKVASGAKITVSFKTPNGGYLAVKREAENPDYFLLSAPENSKEAEFAAAADSLPFWQVETLKSLKQITLDSAQARAVNLSKLNDKGEAKAELIFNQAGWYNILLSNENFEQDDPIITGQCRIYFDKSKVVKISQKSDTAGDKVINWKSEAKNLSFETTLTLKDNQPVAFTLSGFRIFFQGKSETANDCDFAVEKGKDNSVWQTNGNKTVIDGKDESGTPFQMFIQKTNNSFLIDTSEAAEHCFNVGMPGNILLTKSVNKYIGKFIHSK